MFHALLTWALHGGEWPDSRSGRVTNGDIAQGTHWLGAYVVPEPAWTLQQ
jgi:hypothetical protein